MATVLYCLLADKIKQKVLKEIFRNIKIEDTLVMVEFYKK